MMMFMQQKFWNVRRSELLRIVKDMFCSNTGYSFTIIIRSWNYPRLTDPRNFHDWTNLQLQWAYAIYNSHCYFRLNFIDSTDLMNLNYSTCRLCIWINKLWTATKPCFDPLRNVCFTFFYRVWTILIIRNSFFYTNSDADRDRDDANNAVQQTLNNSNSFSIPKIKRRKGAQKSLSWKLFLKF